MNENELADAYTRKMEEAGLIQQGTEPETPAEGTPVAVEPPATPAVEPETEGQQVGTPDAPVADEVQVEADRLAATEAADKAEGELPADASQEEIDAARAQAAEEFYVGRYKTRAEAEDAFAEKDRVLNESLRERAELRQQLRDQEAARLEQEQQEPQQIDVPVWEQWADQQVAAGRAEQAALEAIQTGGVAGYNVLLRSWMNAVDEDGEPDTRARTDAVIFNNDFVMESARIRAQQAVEPVLDDRSERNGREDAQDAEAIIKSEIKDWSKLEPHMDTALEALTPGDREYLKELAGQGVTGKVQALRFVANATRGLSAEQRAQAQIRAHDEERASADRDILAATTVTSEARIPDTPRTEAQGRADKWVGDIRKEMGIADQFTE